MAKIYISSSWANIHQPVLVEELRKRGHQVYDFRHPNGRDDRNVWECVSDRLGYETEYGYDILTPKQFSEMLYDPESESRFKEHLSAMSESDTCILLLPCNRSSHIEAGLMKQMGKRVYVLETSNEVTPELMYLAFDGYLYDKESLYAAVGQSSAYAVSPEKSATPNTEQL